MPVRSDWAAFPSDLPHARRAWAAPNDLDALIECGDDHARGDSWLCRDCADHVARIVADVPALLDDLTLALTRQTSFVQHGTSDETPLPFNVEAADALTRLRAAVASLGDLTRQPDAPALARRLSAEYLHAHRVIDRPEVPAYMGTCPEGHDLYALRDADTVECDCGYHAPMKEHQRTALDAGEDRLLTVAELVGAITSAGETVTRDQINSWIRREGLVREKAARPLWRDGQLVARTVYVYRLGDVRALAQRAERRRAS